MDSFHLDMVVLLNISKLKLNNIKNTLKEVYSLRVFFIYLIIIFRFQTVYTPWEYIHL